MSFSNATPVQRILDDGSTQVFPSDMLGFEVTQSAGDPATGRRMLRAGSAQAFLSAWDGSKAFFDHWRDDRSAEDFDAVTRNSQVGERPSMAPRPPNPAHVRSKGLTLTAVPTIRVRTWDER